MAVGFGIVGVGTWGENHAYVYAEHPEAELVAVCDLNEDAAKAIAKQYGASKVYTDFEQLMADPDVQAVSIATPDFAHAAPVAAAAKAGKHILVEKPLATTVEEAEAIRDIVQKTGITVMVDFHNRWNPAMYEVRQAIAGGEVGRPVSAYIRLSDTLFVPTKMLSWAAKSSVLWFLGSHCLDLLRWFFQDEVSRVYCVSQSTVLAGMGIDTPDVFHTVLQFAGGATAVMDNGWILPESEPSLVDFKLDLVGTEGAMHADVTHNRAVQKYTRTEAAYPNIIAQVEVHGKKLGFTLESIRYFVDCIAGDTEPLVGVDDGLANTKVLVACERSAETGEPIDV